MLAVTAASALDRYQAAAALSYAAMPSQRELRALLDEVRASAPVIGDLAADELAAQLEEALHLVALFYEGVRAIAGDVISEYAQAGADGPEVAPHSGGGR